MDQGHVWPRASLWATGLDPSTQAWILLCPWDNIMSILWVSQLLTSYRWAHKICVTWFLLCLHSFPHTPLPCPTHFPFQWVAPHSLNFGCVCQNSNTCFDQKRWGIWNPNEAVFSVAKWVSYQQYPGVHICEVGQQNGCWCSAAGKWAALRAFIEPCRARDQTKVWFVQGMWHWSLRHLLGPSDSISTIYPPCHLSTLSPLL